MLQLSRLQSAVLSGGLLTTAMGQSLVFAILPPLGREVGLGELQITSIIAISALVFGVSAPFWGRYSDQVGRKPVMLIGLMGYTLGTLLFASLFQAALMGLLSGMALYALVLAGRCVQALIMSATGPAATAYAADHTSADQRTRTMGRLGAAHSMGTIIGPAVSGALATFGLLAPLFFAGFLTAVVAVLTAIKLPRTDPASLSSHSLQKRLRYTDPRVVRYLAAAVGLFIGFSSIQQTLGFAVQDKMQLNGIETAQMTGAALMVSAVFSFLAQLLVLPRLTLKPAQVIYVSIGNLMIATLFVGTFQTFPVLAAGMAFMGMGLGLAMPSISAGASLAVSAEEQGAVAGLVSSCPAIGFVTGPVVAGALYQLDPNYASLFSGLVFVLLLSTLWLTRHRK